MPHYCQIQAGFDTEAVVFGEGDELPALENVIGSP